MPMIVSKTIIVWCPLLEIMLNSSVRKNLLLIKEFKKDYSTSVIHNLTF